LYCHITVVARVHNFIIDSQVLVKANAYEREHFVCRKTVDAYGGEIWEMDKL
jgi:bifunctional ADP-heptose synthase (sugar kinase/adenylyltransferase)